MSAFKLRKVLYMPSTPLNLLLSLAHAYEYEAEQRSSLILIDQKSSQGVAYCNVLKSLKNSPFEQIDLIFGKAKGRQKLKERKDNFAKLEEIVREFTPDVIAVGSDRRVEFQYLMNFLAKSGQKIEGWYLDDGLYSYAGRPYSWFKDEISRVIKKIVYGFWWREPKTVGGSSWIEQAWLFRPEQAVSELKEKQCHVLAPSWFLNDEVATFSTQVCLNFGMGHEELSSLRDLDVFVLIPHPNNIKKMDGYEKRVQDFLLSLKLQGLRIGAKYHPRTESVDPLCLEKNYNALLVPSGVAFEFVLPFFKHGACIVGDVGTALLTAQWLRPDMGVVSVLDSCDGFQEKFIQLYSQFGVKHAESFQEVLFENRSGNC